MNHQLVLFDWDHPGKRLENLTDIFSRYLHIKNYDVNIQIFQATRMFIAIFLNSRKYPL